MNIAPLNPAVSVASGASVADTNQAGPGGMPFVSVIKNMLADVSAHQVEADQAVQQLATGETDSLHHVMLAVAKADLSLHMVLEIRNKLSEAYQEIMRMQI